MIIMTRSGFGAIAAAGAALALQSPVHGAPASAECPAPPAEFGSADRTSVSMEGKIYLLSPGTRKLPDLTTLVSAGSVYAAKWDIAPRAFTQGFPGITDRFEWFAVDYQGRIDVPRAGTYGFRLGSDDGSILYIDGAVVINRDGLRAYSATPGKAELTQGPHEFRLSYFQGPRYAIGLQLWVTPPGEKEKIFNLQDFDRSVLESRADLGVTEDDNAIHVNLGAEVLFDSGKYALRPSATESLKELAVLMKGYPGLPVVIEGHTDSVGADEANQLLSDNRARAVKEWLTTRGGMLAGCITTHGYGETRPIATNDTADGRQKNRRVEIRIQKRKAP
jgi:outer membrane protein OmpA-like peptidoglycan-associated protein